MATRGISACRERYRMYSRAVGSCLGRSATRYSRRLSSITPVQTEHNSRDVKGLADQKKVFLAPKRDPGAVLRALTSTVDELSHPLILGRSPADPLAPRDRREQMEFVMAMEAGRKAADYFIRRWPEMFHFREAEPNMFPEDLKASQLTAVPSAEGLAFLISEKRTLEALKMYKALHSEGVSMSLDIQNGLLKLLAWEGVGNRSLATAASAKQRAGEEEEEKGSEGIEGSSVSEDDDGEVSTGPCDSEVADLMAPGEKSVGTGVEGETRSSSHGSSPSDIERNSDKEWGVRDSAESTWSKENEAERLFGEMEEKNGESYGAMICGLVKFKAHNRALQLFDALLAEGHQASRSTYNALLKALVQSKPAQAWRKAKSILSHMKTPPLVEPNTTTFNHLLDVAKSTGTSQRSLTYEAMQEMEHLGIEPTLTTFLKLLEIHVSSMDVSVLYDIVEYLEKHSEVVELKEPHDIYFFPTAMSAARYSQDCDLAQRIKRLAQKDNWLLVQNVEFFLSHYLALLSSRGTIDTAHNEYKSLVPSVYVPREWVYAGLLDCCTRSKDPDHALELVEDMNKFRVKRTTFRVFERFFNALSVPLNPERLSEYYKVAVQEWKAMHTLGIRPSGFIVGQMVRLSCLLKDVQTAREYHTLFKHYNMKPPFIALSSLLRLHVEMENVELFKETLDEVLKHGYKLATSFVKSNYLNRLPLTAEERSVIMALVQGKSVEEPFDGDQQTDKTVPNKQSLDTILDQL